MKVRSERGKNLESVTVKYSFDGYLYQLEKLKTVLAAGVPSEIALEAVDSCADADAIIKYYRGGTA